MRELEALHQRRFLRAVPLRVSGDDYSFVHKSFYEYFLAVHLLRRAGEAGEAAEVSEDRGEMRVLPDGGEEAVVALPGAAARENAAWKQSYGLVKP